MKAWLLAAALSVGSAGWAAALTPGQTVFIKARNTRVLKTADKNAPVVEVLQPGSEVKWQAKKDAEFHAVTTANGKPGFVYFSNLSLKRPQAELAHSSGSAISAQAFASSGAATKALSDGAVAYGTQKLSADRAVKDVLMMEAISEQVTTQEVAAHVNKVKLVPAVGGSAR